MTLSIRTYGDTTNSTQMSAQSRDRLRVMHLVDALLVGGVERLLVNLARHIDTTRYDLRVCSLTPLTDNSVVRDLRALGAPLDSIEAGSLADPRNVPRLATLMRRRHVDILHTHLHHSDTFGAMAAILLGKPVVSTVHFSFNHATPPFSAAKQAIRGQIMRRGMRKVIACAPEIRAGLIEQLHLPEDHVITIPNAIDVDTVQSVDSADVAARRHELLGRGEGPLVVTVGRLTAQKGHEQLVSAIPLLVRSAPSLKVVIVGRFDENESGVRERIAAAGVEDRVILTGPRSDIAEILAAADIFVFPSVDGEALPLALLEAMAAGKPVVATAVGGVPGVIKDGVTGRLVPPADPAALAQAMEYLLRQPEEARRLADAGRALVSSTYEAGAWARRLENVYDQIATRE